MGCSGPSIMIATIASIIRVSNRAMKKASSVADANEQSDLTHNSESTLECKLERAVSSTYEYIKCHMPCFSRSQEANASRTCSFDSFILKQTVSILRAISI